ncbi:hypothetical protein O1611_g9400 [Lasiodiplodia mahajangana]|uniref:Uncharacterized protein n=1 Tax=Lasiodiplodia mahajangana TaxID=1108764 RepID=A0ACC2JA02_9PEZI|nr:hypothetical protein O1611_g9400 [Lasiodiplodia mahajangana]
MHDAVKEFRKRTRQREKEARKRTKGRNGIDMRSLPESASTAAPQASSSVPPHTPYQGISPSICNTEEGQLVEEQAIYTNASRERESTHPVGEDQLQDAETSRAKVKKKLVKLFTISPRTSSSSSSATMRVESASRGEDPFQDPMPLSRKTKTKAKKAKQRGKAVVSLEPRYNVQDPFRDPEPMRLIDEDDFRLVSPPSEDRPNAIRDDCLLLVQTGEYT